EVPTGQDILACAIRDLERMVGCVCQRREEIVLQSKDWLWKRKDDFFKPCSTGASCSGSCWRARIQALRSPWTTLNGIFKNSDTSIISSLSEIPEEGGVCFGSYREG